jgi:hypothetical protein
MNVDRSTIVRVDRRYRRSFVAAVAISLVAFIISHAGAPHASAEEIGEWNELTFPNPVPISDLFSMPPSNSEPLVNIARGFAWDRRGGLLSEKAQVHTVFFAIGIDHSGIKMFTSPTGEQFLLYYQAADIERSDATGRWQFLGGTGLYEGIRGSGTYTTSEVWPNGAVIDEFEGDYDLPNRTSDQLKSFFQNSLVEDGTK